MTTYRSTGKGWVCREPAYSRATAYMDLADCWARYRAMTSDPIISARGDYDEEIRALKEAVVKEWNLLLDAGKARIDPAVRSPDWRSPRRRSPAQ